MTKAALNPNRKFHAVSEFLFFDNLALYYVIENTPPNILARVLNHSEARLAGSLLGILEPEQRQAMHVIMISQNDHDKQKNEDAEDALLQIASDLYIRGIIVQDGRHFFGTSADQHLKRPDK